MRLFPGYVNYYNRNFIFFSAGVRMSGKSINFDDKRINKSKFYKNKNLFKIDDIDVNKILISKKESYGTKKSFKFFRRLCIKVLQMIGYVKCLECPLRLVIKIVKNYGTELAV